MQAKSTPPEVALCRDLGPLFHLQALSPAGEFTVEIEGPAVDHNGHIVAVAYRDVASLGRVSPIGQSERLLSLAAPGAANGSVFAPNGTLFLADPLSHTIWKVADLQHPQAEVWVQSSAMTQPNDLAVLRDGTLFASDPDWDSPSNGKIWRSDRQGHLEIVAQGLHTPNGIEVSPAQDTLYFAESADKGIWRAEIRPDRSLGQPSLLLDLKRYAGDQDADGIRTDSDGRLYVAINGGATILLVSPHGDIVKTIATPGHQPTNLAFGGVDGCTLYVTDRQERRILQMRVDRPGRSHTLWAD